MSELGNVVPTTGQMTPLAEHLCSVSEGVFTEGVIEDLGLGGVAVLTLLTATHAVAFDRIGALDPAADVKIVNVLFANLVTGKPIEVVPVVGLERHFGLVLVHGCDTRCRHRSSKHACAITSPIAPS